ncbi:MAG: 50S ribosomal protein L11 methyltransferase [Opitutaceae bacterium]|nr:50S ribosomal protein L11 methyltransferase [Opitutaceae bacterium]
MPLFELKLEVRLDAVGEVEEAIAVWEDGRLMLLEDKPSARAWVAGYFEDRGQLHEGLSRVNDVLSRDWRIGEVEIRELADQDWRDSYKAHFRAWEFGRLHWVPIWERDTFVLPPGHAVIWLDPGLAFGTGNHETTRLCCERLVTFAQARERAGSGRAEVVIDAGCGSGILALSAAKLGFARVSGFDNDPEAVRVSGENAALNGLSGQVAFTTADLMTGLTGRRADLLLANIQADVLMTFAPALVSAMAPGGQLVLSGILASENDQVKATFAAAAPGWRMDSRVMGEWSDLVLDRPPT